MIGSTNAGSAGNGGSVQAVAFISVTYPEGSICTCTNGSITLIAEDTSGSWLFEVPIAGEWTISCTDSDKEASEVITVVDNGAYTIILVYWNGMLFEYGDSHTDETGGWNFSREWESNTVAEISNNTMILQCFLTNDGVYPGPVGAITNNKIDLTNYSIVKVYSVEATEATSDTNFRIFISNDTNGVLKNGTRIAEKAFRESTTAHYTELDISNYSGLYYVGVIGLAINNLIRRTTISTIQLIR